MLDHLVYLLKSETFTLFEFCHKCGRRSFANLLCEERLNAKFSEFLFPVDLHLVLHETHFWCLSISRRTVLPQNRLVRGRIQAEP